MSQQQTLMSRVRGWFRRSRFDQADLTDLPSPDGAPGSTHMQVSQRASIFHPFAKRDAALQSLQQGFVTLTDLMVSIREGLDAQGKRQDELVEQLKRLPALLEQLPESARIQAETLKALHQELAAQHVSQQRLTEILGQVSQANESQREVLDGLTDRMDRMRQTDEQIAHNLTNVGATMQELGRSTSTGAQILESLKDNITSRDTELQQVLARQGSRMTIMLSIAIFLSVLALGAVAVMGYLLLTRVQ